jgi:hypothetical protein
MSSRVWSRMAAVPILIAVCVAGAHAQNAGATRYALELRTQTHGFASETAMYTQLMAQLANMPKGPGMPDMSQMMGSMAAMGAPTRRIDGEAAYPGKAPEPIWVTVPTDLKLDKNRLPLLVPKPVELPDDFTGNVGGGHETPLKPMHFEQKLYWNPVVAKGPVTKSFDIDPSKMPTGMSARQMRGALAAAGVMEEADGAQVATGENDKLPQTVVGKGSYTLNTGGVIDLDGFLPPIKVTTPANAADIVTEKGFELKWEPVPGARGFILFVSQFITDPAGPKTTYWVSTTVQPPDRLIWDSYEQATSIADDLRDGILMPPGTTSCVVPPDVFVSGTPLMVSLWAIGNDTWDNTGGFLRQGKIRAQWTGNTATVGMGMGMGGGAGRTPRGLPPGFQMPAPDAGDE